MAQTILIQRGTTTATGDSSATAVTLFTQSGGLGTRVIINQLSFSPAAGTSNTDTKVLLNILSSGGYSNPVGFWWGNSNSVSQGCWSVGVSGDVWGANASAASAIQPNGFGSNDSPNGAGMGSYNMSQLRFGISNGNSYGPTNFWIGPSDAVQIRVWRSSGTATYNIGYSFTTITES